MLVNCLTHIFVDTVYILMDIYIFSYLSLVYIYLWVFMRPCMGIRLCLCSFIVCICNGIFCVCVRISAYICVYSVACDFLMPFQRVVDIVTLVGLLQANAARPTGTCPVKVENKEAQTGLHDLIFLFSFIFIYFFMYIYM